MSGRALSSQFKLLDALKDMPDLVAFFPSEWATPFTAEDLTSPYLKNTTLKEEIVDRAKQLGVPVTVVKNATTPEGLFGIP